MMLRVSRDEVVMHVIATTHVERQVREQIDEPNFNFDCKCMCCQSLYKRRELLQAIVHAICRDIQKERLESN